MSILIYTEHQDGKVKKNSLEAISYGVAIAALQGTEANVLVVGQTDAPLAELGKYGVKKVYHLASANTNTSDTKLMSTLITAVATEQQCDTVIFSNTLAAKGIAPRVAVKMKAGMVSGAVALPELGNGFSVKKNVFSGKAVTEIKVLTTNKVITLNANAFEVKETGGSAEIIALNTAVPNSSITITAVNKTAGEIPLSEADRVISGGRGLKGPENWGMIEELAKLTGAATACSRAVADAHWRPHHEHVGQTGLAISPNLYFAVGISGAIQHLAGVNRSKTIVVINKDPEAPFFKAADYGIVGDAFEVMPKIIQAVKDLG
jgi:electron transfer flavoprotein alpha subunit